MKNIEKIGFFIQARISSERVPQKMIRPFAGSTLIEIALNKVLKSSIIPRKNFYLSAGDQQIIDVGRKIGVQIFNRSQESCMEEHKIQVLFEWHANTNYDYFVRINPCLPLLSISTIDSFVNHFLRSDSEGLFAVTKKKNYIWTDEGQPINLYENGNCFNTKYVKPYLEAAHCLYAGRMDRIAQGIDMGTFRQKNDPELFIINERESFDIDYPWQFDICETLYMNQKIF